MKNLIKQISDFAGKTSPIDKINLAPLFSQYYGKWVALTSLEPDYKFICAGESPKAVYDEAKKLGVEVPTLFKVQSGGVCYRL